MSSHQTCLLDALDSITSTWLSLLGVTFWVCMRPVGCIMQLPSMWGKQMSQLQMSQMLTQWACENTYTHCHGSGCPKQTTAKEDLHIVQQALQNLMTSASVIWTQALDSLQHPTSSCTMFRWQTLTGLWVHHPMCSVRITPSQGWLHLVWWCKQDAWTDDESHCTVFRYESQFCITTDDHRVHA